MALYAASTDGPETNKKFAESLGCDYPILSDPTKETARAYGVLRLGTFASRHTVFIGKDGKILYVDRDVKPATAGADLADRLAALGVARREAAPGKVGE